MRYGITLLTDEPWSVMGPRWVRAEQLGFDQAWTFDHITWGGLPESPWYAAFPTLAAAAATTSRIGLGTFVSSPNNHHPLTLHRQAQTLHDISGGRFLLGVGAGGDLDAAVLGGSLTLGQRSARFREMVRLLRRLDREDHVSHDGRWFRTEDARVLPKAPVHGHPPLLVAANGPRAMQLAAAEGDGWVTYGGPGATDDAAWWALIREASHRMDDALAERQGSDFRRVLNLDGGPVSSLESVDRFEHAAGRAAELGFTDVVTSWPRSSSPYRASEETLEQVAARVLGRSSAHNHSG